MRYTFNAINYDLTNPLELSQSEDGWKNLLIIAECVLVFLEHLSGGGSMMKVAGRDIDQVPNQQPTFDKGLPSKSVAFKFEDGERQADGATQMSMQDRPGMEAEETKEPEKKAANSKGPKWFETIRELDINVLSSFIAFTVQALMATGKWESLVDVTKRLNDVT